MILLFILEGIGIYEVVSQVREKYNKLFGRERNTEDILLLGPNAPKRLPVDWAIEKSIGPIILTPMQERIHKQFLATVRYAVQTRAFELVTRKFYQDKYRSKKLLDPTKIEIC